MFCSEKYPHLDIIHQNKCKTSTIKISFYYITHKIEKIASKNKLYICQSSLDFLTSSSPSHSVIHIDLIFYAFVLTGLTISGVSHHDPNSKVKIIIYVHHILFTRQTSTYTKNERIVRRKNYSIFVDTKQKKCKSFNRKKCKQHKQKFN